MKAGNQGRPEKGGVTGLLGRLVGKGHGKKNSRDDAPLPKKTSSLTKKGTAAPSNPVPGKVKAGKGSLSPSPIRSTPPTGPKYFFHSNVSDGYDESYMRALPRDPEWIFVYWEISKDARKDLLQKMGRAEYESSKTILRLIDVAGYDYDGSNPRQYVDMEIDKFATSKYLRIQEYGKTYILEYGFLTSSGRFFRAVRSNRVNVPRFGLSPFVDANWYSVNTEELISMSSMGNGRTLGASEKRFDVFGENAAGMGELFGISEGSGSGMFGMPGNGIR
jgi:hypothetical protein